MYNVQCTFLVENAALHQDPGFFSCICLWLLYCQCQHHMSSEIFPIHSYQKWVNVRLCWIQPSPSLIRAFSNPAHANRVIFYDPYSGFLSDPCAHGFPTNACGATHLLAIRYLQLWCQPMGPLCLGQCFIILSKYITGHKCLRPHYAFQKWVTESVSRWQWHILSCTQTVSGHLKTLENRYILLSLQADL